MNGWFAWVSDPMLRQGLENLLAGLRPAKSDAESLVRKLIDEGERHTLRHVGPTFYSKNFPTNRHGASWGAGQPSGWVDHYTADPNVRGTLMWFSNMDRGPKGGNSSAHFVVDKDGSVMTLVNPLTTVAWHATWANPTHIGAENVNTGLLRKSATGEYIYLDNTPYPAALIPQLQRVGAQMWEPFTTAQVVASLVLKRLMIAARPSLVIEKFVDHQVIDPAHKVDCGPLWPLRELNKLAFSWKGIVEAFDWMQSPLMTTAALAEFKATAQQLAP